VETSLKGKAFVVPSTIIPNDNVKQNVKCKLEFDSFKQKPS
jgi:hypothetical protein